MMAKCRAKQAQQKRQGDDYTIKSAQYNAKNQNRLGNLPHPLPQKLPSEPENQYQGRDYAEPGQ